MRVCVRLGEAWRDVARDGRRGVRPIPSPTVERLHWDSLRLVYQNPSAALQKRGKDEHPTQSHAFPRMASDPSFFV